MHHIPLPYRIPLRYHTPSPVLSSPRLRLRLWGLSSLGTGLAGIIGPVVTSIIGLCIQVRSPMPIGECGQTLHRICRPMPRPAVHVT